MCWGHTGNSQELTMHAGAAAPLLQPGAEKPIKYWLSHLGQHPCSSDGPAFSPLGLVRRVRLVFMPSRWLVRQGKVDSVMFCLSCSRKDCWMLRNLNVRMNWPGQRLAAYVSRVKWSTYQKQIASSFSALQGNNFLLYWNCHELQTNSKKRHENSLINTC